MYHAHLLPFGSHSFVALALLSWSAVIPEVSAQSLPSTCRPAGGNLECTRVFVSPYRFSAGTCSVPSVQPSESAAWDKFMEPSHHHCIVSVTDIGRLTPSSPNFSVPCGGNGSYSSRIEHDGHVVQDNRLADWYGSADYPVCGTPYHVIWGAVGFEREPSLSGGFRGSNELCTRSLGVREPGKALGNPCEPGGCVTPQPINVAAGNKFRAETDYSVAGSPLKFVRYYNSFPNNSTSASLYRDTSFEQTAGLSGYARVATEPSEATQTARKVKVGEIGVGWRHSYQRMVISNKGISISSAYVARPDGKVHTYTNHLGVWHGQSDIPNKLNEILDGGGNTTGWSITLDDGSVESYAADGRLLEICSRQGHAVSDIRFLRAPAARGRLLRQGIVFHLHGKLRAWQSPAHRHRHRARGWSLQLRL